MILFYIKTILNNFRKAGIATVFNLVGLSISFAAFILLSIYLYNEFTYDKHNVNYKNIYRLNLENDVNGKKETIDYLPNPMADVIYEKTPELVALCSFAYGQSSFATNEDEKISYNINCQAVDSSFTNIFTIKIKAGSQQPLKGKSKIIISEKTAVRIFGDADPIGQTLYANFKTPYVIDAVFYDLPINSSFRYDAFCSYPTNDWVNNWSEYSFNHYFLVSQNADFDKINREILEIEEIKKLTDSYPDSKISFTFTALKDLHFDKKSGGGNLLFSKILIMVAILLLFMAYVNYVNFAMANTPKLLKFVCMRSVVGETKSSLILSSILENALLMCVSFLFAIVICLLTISLWPDIFGYQVWLSENMGILLICFLIFIFFGTLVSIYPSKIIIDVNPALALKGIITFSSINRNLGKILTVFQYAISIFLIIGILFIEKQLMFLSNFDLGFNKDNILVVNTTPDIRNQETSFADELMKNPNITDYAFSQFVPSGVGMGWGREIEGKQLSFKCWPIDEKYMGFMGFDLVEGRCFSSNIEVDENNFIFNQKALEEFEWNEGYLGKEIPGFGFKGKLVGVVKDMKYASLHEEVQPMAFWLTKTRHNKLSLKINGRNIPETIDYIKTVYSRFETKFPINYKFLDETLETQYKTEKKQAKLIFVFCLVSIVISIVGALGLINFMCENKVKEIGIRKVNGATISEIVYMLNISFMKWVLTAFLISAPLSYLAVNKWLDNFAYKTEINWWVFLLAGFVAASISLLTVSWRSWRAATLNPVKSLRRE